MRICLIADAQVPHSINWIKVLTKAGHKVSLISTYPTAGEGLDLEHLEVVTLDPSARLRATEKAVALGTKTVENKPLISKLRGSGLWASMAKLRDRTVPWRIASKSRIVTDLIQEWEPDVVHAMRVTFEGVLAQQAVSRAPRPLVLSTWGNDFSFFAAASPTATKLVQDAVSSCDGLHSDCHKDVTNAHRLGLRRDVPVTVAPGNGGINRDIFYPGDATAETRAKFEVPNGARVILNPRGMKAGIRNDTFFAAMPAVLAEFPDTVFVCLGAAGNRTAIDLAQKYGVTGSTRLVGTVQHHEMPEIFRLADTFVSPSEHDGTPNSMLEAMACGAFPVLTPLEGVCEWIEDEKNGLFFDVEDVAGMGNQMIRSLRDTELRARVLESNQTVIEERASQSGSLRLLEQLYKEAIGHWQQNAPTRSAARNENHSEGLA